MTLNKLNHIYDEPLVVSSLNTTGDTVVNGSLTTFGAATLNSASIGAVTSAQIQYLSTLTSNVQTQLNDKVSTASLVAGYAALTGASFSGGLSATSLTLSTTPLAVSSGGSGLSATTKGGVFVGTSTTAFTNVTVGLDGYLLTADSAQASGLKWAAAPVSLPTQTSNAGKYLTTDGTTASWATIQALPTQTSNAGKFLTTDGTSASWLTLTASNLTGGTLSSAILGNSAAFIGTTSVALNRTSGNQGLTGISSVAFPGSTSGTTTIQPSAVAGTTTFTLPATTGTAALQGDTHYIGTTAIALNRASATQTLTGVSIDGNAATATNGLTTGNYNSYAPTLTGTGASGTWGISISGNAASATTASSVTNGLTTSNYSSYALPLSGGTMTGLITGKANTGGTILNSNDTGAISIRGVTSTNAAAMSFHIPGSYAINMGLDTDNNFKIGGWSAGIIMMTLTPGGNMTLPGTLTINSDAKLKENLTPLTNALSKVNALTGYNYNRIGSDKLEMGVVAQEVQKVAPELIHEDYEGTLSVAYQNMIALLIEAVKEQSAEIATLKEQVEKLKG